MKIILAALVIATAAFTAPSSAQARDYGPSYCAPYVVCTHKLYSCQERRMGHDHCGRCYYYYVTVVTYKDVYNTGYTRTYTKTFRGLMEVARLGRNWAGGAERGGPPPPQTPLENRCQSVEIPAPNLCKMD